MGNQLLSTSFATLAFEDGLITTIRNDHLRQTFAFPEQLEIQIEGSRYLLNTPQCSDIYEELTTLDDFLSGNDRLPETRKMQILYCSWEVAGARFEREVLLTSIEHNDCAFYFRYHCSKSASVYWSIPLVHTEFSRVEKNGTYSEVLAGVIHERGEFLRRNIFQIGDKWPPQHVNCYFNYKDDSLHVDIDESGKLSTSFHIRSDWTTSSFFMHYASGAFCSDTIFFVENSCWHGAVAAIAYGASAHAATPLFKRCWQGKFTSLLWFDQDQGIAHYQRLLMSFPKIQTMFVFGRVSFQDYLLLKHMITQKEGKGSEHAPNEASSRRVAKILLVYEDDNLAYTHGFLEQLKSAISEWINDAQSSAFPAYLPVTEPIVLDSSRPLLPQYQQAIWDRFSPTPTKSRVSFVISEDPTVAGIVAPLARYLHGTIEMRSDLESEITCQETGISKDEHPVRYIARKVINGRIPEPRTAATEAIYLIEYKDAAELAFKIASIFQNAKLFDLYLMYKSAGGHVPIQVVFEDSFPEHASSILLEIGQRASRREPIPEETLAYARALLGAGFFSRLLNNFNKGKAVSLSDVLSPVNFPLLTPHVILSGTTDEGAVHNLYSAANYSAARLVPILLVESKGNGAIWTQVSGSLNRSVYKDSTDGVSHRSFQQLSAALSGSLHDAVDRLAKDLSRLFPDVTLMGMDMLKPLFLTFIPGEASIPYELAQLAVCSDDSLHMSRFIGVSSPHGHIGLSHRIGRLAGSTMEMTSQLICQSVLVYSSFREWPVRFGSFGDTLCDLKEASKEITAIIQFVQRLMNELGQHAEVFEVQGRRCTAARFIDVCNRGLDIIHFAGHAQASGIDFSRSSLRMSDTTIGPAEITEALRLSRNPVVIMNACESVRPPGLIPDALISAGAGAIIGTLWPVFDEEASLFARHLVGNIIAGFSIGAALQNAKANVSGGVYDNRQSAKSWNSYILYGDPTWIPMIENFRNPSDSLAISERLITSSA